MTEQVFIDEFSTGLDELSRRRQRSTREVLKALLGMKRVSVFEITENDVIAATVQRIVDRKLAVVTPGTYPWSDVEVTDAGRDYIEQKRKAA
ncbi:hypothetical protein [Rhizobium leguminosarum]|uniref:hypothetical protein n=1 Tax=Rhizobium leguminosarum TaxID=384 RepID=UPI002E1145A4|nr:hypothetical protein U8Q02_42785 [Rhizobium leguminosarum]